MASGTKSMSNSGVLQGRISWSSTYSMANNRSTITAKLQAKVLDSAFEVSGVAVNSLKFTINYSLSAASRSGSKIDSITGAPVITFTKGGSWVTVATLKFNSTHAANGSNYVYISSACSMKSGSGSASLSEAKLTLDTIYRGATISSAPNFNDEENPTITYSNPSGSNTTLLQACISLTGSTDDIAYRDLDISGTSYTFELTEEERNILRNATLDGSASRKVRFYVKSTVAGYNYSKNLEKTFTVINADPDLSAFLLDTNEKTVALTGDSLASLIKGYSNVSYEMSAKGLKGASIVSYSAVNGSNTLTTDSGTFNGANDATFKLSATDNRGLTTTREFTLNMIDYFKPTCSQEATIEMSGETSAKIIINVNGEWSSKHFGAVHNSLRVECRYKAGNGSWSAWEGADYISDNNTYKITYTKDGLLYSNAYTVQSRAVDLLETATTGEYTLKLIPVFDWSEEDFNFNVPVNVKGDLTVEGNIIIGNESSGVPVDYIIEQGTEAMGTNGTWYWSKWKNGRAECYGCRNYGNMGISNAWGDLYESTAFSQPLPSGLFMDVPEVISINFRNSNYGAWVEQKGENISADSTGTFFVVRANNGTLSQVHLSFDIIGRWK